MTTDQNHLPLLAVAGGGLLLWSLLRRGQATTPASEIAKADADLTEALRRLDLATPATRASQRPAGSDWQWPVPMWGEYGPSISSGWGSPRKTLDGKPRTHRGVDLMYERHSLDDHAAEFPRDTAGGSKWHFMPPEVPALAARDGKVTYAERTARGYAVVIKHADGWSTFYQHLGPLRVARGDVVSAGQVLGLIGGDPTQKPKLRHLHFEIRRPDGSAINPKPVLLTWSRVRLLPLAYGGIGTVLYPPPRHA